MTARVRSFLTTDIVHCCNYKRALENYCFTVYDFKFFEFVGYNIILIPAKEALYKYHRFKNKKKGIIQI